jgi:hypothetical protein
MTTMDEHNQPEKVKDISDKQIEMLAERIIEEDATLQSIMDVLVHNSELSCFTMSEWRSFYSREGLHVELRPVPTDTSTIQGFENVGVIQGTIEHFDLLQAMKGLEGLGVLENLLFDFWGVNPQLTDPGSPRFIVECELRFEGQLCPLMVELYVEEPFEDAEPVEFDPDPPGRQ